MSYLIFQPAPGETPKMERLTREGWASDDFCWLINKMLETEFIDPHETQEWLMENIHRRKHLRQKTKVTAPSLFS